MNGFRIALLLATGSGLIGACSLINAPDAVQAGAGGGGGDDTVGVGVGGKVTTSSSSGKVTSSSSASASESSTGAGGFSPLCGNDKIDPGETCDPPSTCPMACDDGNPCTSDVLSGSLKACNVKCTSTPITTCGGVDGCCPMGCTGENDKDCIACGNGIVEPGETCDPPSSCPTAAGCNDGIACTADVFTGAPATCNAACKHTPIAACVSGDGCCPAGCTKGNDSDCCNKDLAIGATASISGGGAAPCCAPSLMNDGVVGKLCGSFAWISNTATPGTAWAELDWASAVTIASMYVETETTPPVCGTTRNIASAIVQWWNGAAWVNATTFSGQTGDVKIDISPPVTTTKLRMYAMASGATNNSILWEWHVYSNPGCTPEP